MCAQNIKNSVQKCYPSTCLPTNKKCYPSKPGPFQNNCFVAFQKIVMCLSLKNVIRPPAYQQKMSGHHLPFQKMLSVHLPTNKKMLSVTYLPTKNYWATFQNNSFVIRPPTYQQKMLSVHRLPAFQNVIRPPTLPTKNVIRPPTYQQKMSAVTTYLHFKMCIN